MGGEHVLIGDHEAEEGRVPQGQDAMPACRPGQLRLLATQPVGVDLGLNLLAIAAKPFLHAPQTGRMTGLQPSLRSTRPRPLGHLGILGLGPELHTAPEHHDGSQEPGPPPAAFADLSGLIGCLFQGFASCPQGA